ncbi:hypothetical protein [Streptomyces sp. IBSBF 2435]|uniref:hypothetical protein n=1 Tax=Streptomyces sp. IBSBF 2435 TaxID=2903531 RepID=UPI002FDBC5A8
MSAALVAAAVLIAVDRRQDLISARRLVATARPERLAVAAFSEALSLACLASLQRRLLRLGGARLGLGLVGVMIVAANAVAGALPGGAAFAAAWQFGQMRRRRVPPGDGRGGRTPGG